MEKSVLRYEDAMPGIMLYLIDFHFLHDRCRLGFISFLLLINGIPISLQISTAVKEITFRFLISFPL
jgi:hypothetical protein